MECRLLSFKLNRTDFIICSSKCNFWHYLYKKTLFVYSWV